jgi:hypothetical protein
MTGDLTVAAGDVLLYRGSSWISRAIRWFDGSDVNHAAIALGPGEIAEATAHGLDRADLDDTIARNDWTIQRRLVGAPDGRPLTDVAGRYLADGVPYGYHQIVLLAILAATRRIPLPWVAKRLVRSALDAAADVLSGYVDQGGRRFMICSEYVYRCYDEATDDRPDPYDIDLEIGGADLAAAGPTEADTFLHWALHRDADLASEAESLAGALAAPLGAGPDLVAVEAELDRLIQEYAFAAAGASPAIAADLDDMPSPLTIAPRALSDPEPTEEELLAAHIRLAATLEQSRDDPEPLEPLGIGTDVLTGLLRGLVKVEASPNFVTPGDLHGRAHRLVTLGEVRH